MPRVYATFVGCKVSQADCGQALDRFVAAGFESAEAPAEADVCLLMTCCVTAEAERKSRRLARRLAGDGRRVLVAGCAATLRAAQFGTAGVEIVVDDDWERLADKVTGHGARDGEDRDFPSSAAVRGSPGKTVVPELVREASVPVTGRYDGRTRSTIKVQDGCSGVCSYCVVPLVRGRPRSTPLPDVLEAARRALADGAGEIVLSGIDLGAYRDAPAGGSGRGDAADLADLMAALVRLPGLLRLRLSSVEPDAISDRLVEALAHPLVARHVHMPLQSADDGVLVAMRRRYTFTEFTAAVDRVRSRLSDAMLSTDVIVGFPTEDDAAFERTLAVLESGLFGRVHVFAYSRRPGTMAAALDGVPADVVRARASAAGLAAREAQRRAARAAVGRRAEVLIEERRDGLWKGYSSQYVRYYLEGPAERGQLVCAVAEGLYADGVKGRLVEETPGGPAEPAGGAAREDGDRRDRPAVRRQS